MVRCLDPVVSPWSGGDRPLGHAHVHHRVLRPHTFIVDSETCIQVADVLDVQIAGLHVQRQRGHVFT